MPGCPSKGPGSCPWSFSSGFKFVFLHTLIIGLGLPFDKKNSGGCHCFLGCWPLPWQGAGSCKVWELFYGFFWVFKKYFLCLDGSCLGVVLARLEVTFCCSSNNFPLLSVIWFCTGGFGFRDESQETEIGIFPHRKAEKFYFVGLSFASSSYFMRPVWVSYATLECLGFSLRSSPWHPASLLGARARDSGCLAGYCLLLVYTSNCI